jgi:hypothetical protein
VLAVAAMLVVVADVTLVVAAAVMLADAIACAVVA